MDSSRGKSWLWFFFKVAVSVGLLAYLIWIVDWELIRQTLAVADLRFAAIAPLLYFISMLVGAARWQLFLRDSRVHLRYSQSLTGYYLGASYSVFLPGVIGGDAVRIGYCVSRTGCGVGTAVASVITERVLGLLALLSLLLTTLTDTKPVF